MAPGHVDLSVLWVPIMPETSKLGPAMEDAGKSATESFDKGTSGLGDKLHDSFTKATGKVKDVFTKAGSDASDSMADSVKQSTKVEDALEDTGKKASGRFKGAFDGIAEKLGTEIGAKIGGGIGDQLQKVDGYAAKVGIDISEWTSPLKDASGEFDSLKAGAKDIEGQIRSVTSNFEGMPGKVGKVASAIGELALPLAMVEQGLEKINNLVDKAGGQRKWDDVVNPQSGDFPNYGDQPNGPGFWDKMGRLFQSWTPGGTMSGNQPKPAQPKSDSQYNDMLLGGAGSSDQASSGFTPGGDPKRWGGTLGSGSDAYDAFSGGVPVTGPGSIAPPAATSPESTTAPNIPSFTGSVSSSASSPAELHASGSRIANLYKVAQALQGTPYSQGLRNDCSGMVSKLATAALGMSPSAAFSTQNEGQWLMSHGFQPGMGGPNDLNIGWYNHGSDPNSGHTAATLPGGINAESGGSSGAFALGGSVGDGSSQFDQHAHLSMDGSGGSLGIPTGAQHDPLYIMPADSGGGGGGGSSQDQAQQLGSGFLDGLMQSVGLDGSVFKGFGGSSNPLHFGITKLATGLVNTFAGGGGEQGGGGSLGGGGSMLSGLGGLIPHGSVPTGPGGAQNVRTGDTTNHFYGDTGPQLTVNQQGVQSPTEDLHGAVNGAANRMPAYTAPNGGGGPTPP